MSRFRFFGTKPAPVPWILCGPGLAELPGEGLRDDGRVLRLHGDRLKAGLAGLDDLGNTPVIVPPVPTAETKMSTLPSVSFQISSAVVLLWMPGLAGLLNCWGIQEFSISD